MKKVTLGILCLFTLCLGLFGCSNEKDFVINYDLIKANQEENKVVNKIESKSFDCTEIIKVKCAHCKKEF